MNGPVVAPLPSRLSAASAYLIARGRPVNASSAADTQQGRQGIRSWSPSCCSLVNMDGFLFPIRLKRWSFSSLMTGLMALASTGHGEGFFLLTKQGAIFNGGTFDSFDSS